MNAKKFFISLLASGSIQLLLGIPALADDIPQADTIKVPVSAQGDPQLQIPQRGQSRVDVELAYGEPARITGVVGKPPISTWHYDDFSVYFESEQVIHAVRRR